MVSQTAKASGGGIPGVEKEYWGEVEFGCKACFDTDIKL